MVFIDQNVPDYDQLMADLANKDNIDVFILDSSVDGIEQISESLIKYQNLDALHFVTHGNDGNVHLGSTWMSKDNIGSYGEALALWGSR